MNFYDRMLVACTAWANASVGARLSMHVRAPQTYGQASSLYASELRACNIFAQGHITICCNCINSSFYFLHKEQEYLRGDYINTNSGIGLFIFTPHWLNILCIMKKVFLAKWITRLEHVKWLLRLCISQLLTANHSHFTYTIFFILTDHKYVARQG